jgi:hypothetical protein
VIGDNALGTNRRDGRIVGDRDTQAQQGSPDVSGNTRVPEQAE